jgi:type IV pilus assembly protein PilY1
MGTVLSRASGMSFQGFALCGAVAALTLSSGVAQAGLANQPLTLAGAAEPNVLVIIDDSGSMDWEMLFPTESGQLHWNFDADLPVDDDGNFFTTAQGRAYSYLFPNGTGSGNKSYPVMEGDGTLNGNGQALAPRPEFAFARSAAFNAQYYDPAVTYKPWPSRGGYTFADATPRAALSDPTVTGSSTLNLTAELYRTDDDNWKFTTSGGARGVDASGNPSDDAQESRSIDAYRYFPATYYVPVKDSLSLPAWLGGGNCNSPEARVFRTFVLDWSNANQDDLEAAKIDAIAPGGVCLRKYEIKSGNTFPGGRSYDDEIQNFANWFTYHRKRHLALRAGLGVAFDDKTGLGVGSFTINDRDAVTMWDLDTNKNDFYTFMYEVRGGTGSTPNRQALRFAGEQFNRTETPVITQACQKNFSLLFTDGYANSFTNRSGILDFEAGNADGNNGDPFDDTETNTIADIAMKYYETRLRTGLTAGKVPTSAECSFANVPPYLDCNRDLHMNTYAVTLGARGNVFGNTHFSVRDAHTTPPTWPNPNATGGESRPVQVDDLYHAAVNGRGELLNARSTAELSEKLGTALQSILASVIGSSSAVSSNSTRLDADTLIYQARFDSRRWSGELIAFGLKNDGDIGARSWDAGQRIPDPVTRKIYTRNSSGAKIKLEWGTGADQLDASQRAALDRDGSGTTDGRGEARVAWLRGVRTGERPSGELRQRDRVLGDIVNSSPWFVGGQNFGYDQLPAGAAGKDTYAAFRQNNANVRAKTIYVGANDGMLHAFDAATGNERFAYMPSQFLNSASGAAPINALTDPAYSHRYYVDGTPVAGDAYFGGAWHTVLVGTLGAGGKGVFALDVTNPSAFDESAALWEFNDAALGNVIGRASIARMANGKYAAIFGNGFGSGAAATLFIVDLADGSLIKAISTDTDAVPSDNGLSPPIPVDTNGDRVIDYIYAGDYYGNLWKFDVTASNESSWKVAFEGTGSVKPPLPLYRACASGDANDPFATSGSGSCSLANRQPITMRPEVGRGPSEVSDSLMIYFGTGKFFETGDNVVDSNTPVQSFYAIRDNNTNSSRVSGRSKLVQQQITHELAYDANDNVRVTTNNAVTPVTGGSAKFGWYLDLVSPPVSSPVKRGERVIAQPILREGKIIFTTLIPSGDACDAGGTSWLMELQALSGARPPSPVFDLNDDGAFTDADNVDHDGNSSTPKIPPSGRQSGVGIIQTPAIISAGAVEYKITGGSTGGIESVTEKGNVSKGRNSWKQLWPGN